MNYKTERGLLLTSLGFCLTVEVNGNSPNPEKTTSSVLSVCSVVFYAVNNLDTPDTPSALTATPDLSPSMKNKFRWTDSIKVLY